MLLECLSSPWVPEWCACLERSPGDLRLAGDLEPSGIEQRLRTTQYCCLVNQEQEAGVKELKVDKEELLSVTHRSKTHWETALGLGNISFRNCIGFFVRFSAIGRHDSKLFLDYSQTHVNSLVLSYWSSFCNPPIVLVRWSYLRGYLSVEWCRQATVVWPGFGNLQTSHN